MASGNDDNDEVPTAPKRRRKNWLITGNVPRSTLMRWEQQEERQCIIEDSDEESSQSTSSTSSTSSDSSTSRDSSINGDSSTDVDIDNNEDGEHFDYFDGLDYGGEGDDGGAGGDDDGAGGDDDDDEEGGEGPGINNEEEFEEAIFDFQFEPHSLFKDSKITCGEAIVQLMNLYSKHAMTKSCLKDLIKFIHRLLPVGNSFPPTYHFLYASLKPFIPPNSSVRHGCCEDCGSYKGKIVGRQREVQCEVCESTKTVMFYEFDLAARIKYLFERRNLADAIDSYGAGKGADITRSEEYQRVKENLPGKYDLQLQWNFDGVQTHKSSYTQMWPIMFSICEVAPQVRDKFIVVAGLWHAKKKPKVNSYLQPFARSLIKARSDGVTWIHPRTKEVHISKVAAPIVSVDAPARAMAQNLLQYNGEFSCNICEIQGMEFRLGPKSRKKVFPFPEVPDPLRTKESIKDAATRAENDNTIVKGVKGSSILEAIPDCDTAKGINLDYMHLVLLGCVRSFYVMWFTKKDTDWYIGGKTKQVTDFLKMIKRTYETTRCPSDASKWKLYKASTWRTWLLSVSLPALQAHLKEKYFQHWTYFVVGISLLLQENISENELVLSENLLSIFVRDTQELYGYSAMTYNLHGVLHLPLITRRWGALWGISLFKFENTNGILTRHMHGTYRIATELSNTLNLIIATNTLDFLMHHQQVLAHGQLKLLSRKELSDLPAADRQALVAHFQDRPPFTIFARAQIRRPIYTSQVYGAEKTTDNKNVCFKNGQCKCYGVVQCYVECGGTPFALIRQLLVQPDRRFKINEINLFVRHIIPVESTEIMTVLPLQNISHKVMRVHGFVCEELNHFEQIL